MSFSFEWDPDKAASNLAKHRVSFFEAETVFADPLALEADDLAHSFDEERFLMVGRSFRERLLIVAFTERGSAIRIISAREATPHERRAYERRA
jgi:uncharacterized protein